MPKETYPTLDGVQAVVTRAGLKLNDDHLEALNTHENNRYASTIRNAHDKEHVNQDLEDLKSGVLDEESFIQGYLPQEHPVQYEVHDSDGNLKQRIHSHNLRTDIGGQLQGLQLMGDNPTNYPSQYTTAAANNVVQGQTLTASTVPSTTAMTALTGGSVAGLTGLPTPASGTGPTLLGGLAGRIAFISGGNAPATTGAWGIVLNNTATQINVDFWRVPGASPEAYATTGTAAAATTVTVFPAVPPFMYMSLSNDATAVGAADTAAQGFNLLTQDSGTTTIGEYGIQGLVRKSVTQTAVNADGTNASPMWFSPLQGGTTGNVVPYLPGYTGSVYTGAAAVTQTGAFKNVIKFGPTTGTGSAATINKSALFNSAVNYTGGGANATTGTAAANGAGVPVFVAKLTTPATLQFGDTLTVTWQLQF